MPHTPQFARLLTALRDVRVAGQQGIPIAELVERRAERRVSRREFLKLSAAAAALATIPGCLEGTTIDDPGDAQQIVIIGAGLAGLHCAHRLNELGIGSKIFEARRRLGGRISTDRTTFPGSLHCERGGEFIDSGHETMLDLAEEFDVELLDYRDDASPGLRELIAYIDGRTLTEAEILAGFVPIAAAIDNALASLTDQDDLFVYFDKPNGGEVLDALSISAWFDREGITGPVRKLLEVAYTIEFGTDPEVSNCLNLIFMISTDTTDFQIFGDSDERFHAADGNDIFIERLGAAMQTAQVVFNSPLAKIVEESDGKYTLTFQRGRITTELVTSHVVLALPFTMLREVEMDVELPSAKRLAIDELGYGQNTKLMAGFNSRNWREMGSAGITFSDLPYQNTWDTSRLQPGEDGILTEYTGGTRAVLAGRGTGEAALEEFLDDIDQVFPGLKDDATGISIRQAWDGDPWAKASYSAYRVGQYTQMAGAEFGSVGNLHFCGEHTSLDFQGFMEGAALTGAAVAATLAEDFGVSATAAAMPTAAGQRIMERARRLNAERRLKRLR